MRFYDSIMRTLEPWGPRVHHSSCKEIKGDDDALDGGIKGDR